MGNRSSSRKGNEAVLRPQQAITKLTCPPLCSTRTLSYNIDRRGPLHALPEEMFFKVLLYVPPMDLIFNGRLVCKYWLDIIDSQKFWRLKCQEENIAFPMFNTDDNSFPLDFRCIYLKRPFNRNLVKNWNAADEFNFWTIEENGGDLFAVEPNECGYANPISSIGIRDCSNCWVTSYHLCTKSQTIDLLAEGCTREILDVLKPTIEISEWTAARYDCGSQYFVNVTLESSEGKVLDVFKSERFVGQWEDMSWIKVSHKFCNYPAGVRYVKVLHGGKDRQFWAGHYGPKITATCVIVSLKNCHLCQGETGELMSIYQAFS